MKDKNGKTIEVGMTVDVPTPIDNDIHNFEFEGYVEALEYVHGYVIVMDGDGECFAIEPEKLEIVG